MHSKERFMSEIREIPGISENLMEAAGNAFSAVFESDEENRILGWISLSFPDESELENKDNLSAAASDLESRFIAFLDKSGIKTHEITHGKNGELEADAEFPPAFVPDFMKATPESKEADALSETSSVSDGATADTETASQGGLTLTYLLSTGNPNASTMGIDFSESIPNEEELMENSTITVHIDNPRGPYAELAK